MVFIDIKFGNWILMLEEMVDLIFKVDVMVVFDEVLVCGFYIMVLGNQVIYIFFLNIMFNYFSIICKIFRQIVDGFVVFFLLVDYRDNVVLVRGYRDQFVVLVKFFFNFKVFNFEILWLIGYFVLVIFFYFFSCGMVCFNLVDYFVQFIVDSRYGSNLVDFDMQFVNVKWL